MAQTMGTWSSELCPSCSRGGGLVSAVSPEALYPCWSVLARTIQNISTSFPLIVNTASSMEVKQRGCGSVHLLLDRVSMRSIVRRLLVLMKNRHILRHRLTDKTCPACSFFLGLSLWGFAVNYLAMIEKINFFEYLDSWEDEIMH